MSDKMSNIVVTVSEEEAQEAKVAAPSHLMLLT